MINHTKNEIQAEIKNKTTEIQSSQSKDLGFRLALALIWIGSDRIGSDGIVYRGWLLLLCMEGGKVIVHVLFLIVRLERAGLRILDREMRYECVCEMRQIIDA